MSVRSISEVRLQRHDLSGRGASTFLLRLLDVAAWPLRVIRARQQAWLFASMSDRELADIGLSGGDVRDLAGLRLDQDPTRFLARRRHEARLFVRRP